jgi:hypothetical protein
MMKCGGYHHKSACVAAVHFNRRFIRPLGQGFAFQGHFSAFLASWIPDSTSVPRHFVGLTSRDDPA